MKIKVIGIAAACALLGFGTGLAARQHAPGIAVIRGKPAKEAGLAALAEAEKLAGKGSWERIAVGRIKYLSGDKPGGQAMFDQITSGKVEGSDWQRLGEVYAEAGEKAKAEDYFARAQAANPDDDSGAAEIGAWYIRQGQRDKGEELLARAFAHNPDEIWHYTRAAEALLNVPPGR